MSLRIVSKIKLKYVCCIVILIMVLDFFGVFTHFFEIDFNENFVYPYEGNVQKFVADFRHNRKPDVGPINQYNYSYIHELTNKCTEPEYSKLRIVYIVKSAIEHFDRRNAIRKSWGFEKRFFDVPSRTIFLLGCHPNDNEIQEKVNLEVAKYNDIVQATFVDTYYNNTIKTMMGFKWAVKHCSNSKFYMFVDDDIYVSVKNVLRFVRNPVYYPDYLKEPKKMETRKREIREFNTQDFTNLNNTDINDKKIQQETFNLHDIDQRRVIGKDITAKQIFESKRHKRGFTDKEILASKNLAEKSRQQRPTNLQFKSQSNLLNRGSQINGAQGSLLPKALNNSNSIQVRSKRQVFDFELPEDVRLFAGFVFVSAPHRHKSSKWYVSLKEYPYHQWPPYVTAGSYILSKEALLDMYYTSLYTQHFKFDDIFLGLVAKKADIEPFHCEEFHFYKKEYTKYSYKYVISSHGYGDPNELLEVWNEQKVLGNA